METEFRSFFLTTGTANGPARPLVEVTGQSDLPATPFDLAQYIEHQFDVPPARTEPRS